MENSNNLDVNILEESLTEKDLLPIKIIVGALNAGVVVFLLIALYIFSDVIPVDAPGDNDFQIANILMVVLALLSMTTFYISKIIPDKILDPDGLLAKNISRSAKTDKQKFIGLLTNYFIVKLALMEAPALFGLVIIILTSISGVIHHYSVLWLSIIPLIIMLAYSITNFPNMERVLELLRRRGF